MKTNRKFRVESRRVVRTNAFTLIELLTVIGIIGILAALLVSGVGVARTKTSKKKVETELQKLMGAIESYKSKIGSYPPDNTNDPGRSSLFYELMATYTTNNGGDYFTLDGREAITQTSVTTHFGTGGFVNVGASASTGRGFLSNPKPSEYMQVPYYAPTENIVWLVAPLPGTNILYGGTNPAIPPTAIYPKLNPWRYVSSHPTNNPKTYDLWAEVRIGDQTFIIGNWK